MLRMALIILWKIKLPNKELYQNLSKVSQTIAQQSLRLAGHCVWHEEEIANQLVLWEPTRGPRRRGRQAVIYVDCLKRNTGLDDINDLSTAMMNRDDWRNRIKLGRAGVRPR